MTSLLFPWPHLLLSTLLYTPLKLSWLLYLFLKKWRKFHHRTYAVDVPILGDVLSQITLWLVLQLSFNFAQVSSNQWNVSWPPYLKFILCAWSIINKSKKNKNKTKHQGSMTFKDLVYRWCNNKYCLKDGIMGIKRTFSIQDKA